MIGVQPNSMRGRTLAALKDCGQGTADDIQPALTGMSRQQIRSALDSLVEAGRIVVISPGKALGAARGCSSAVYALSAPKVRVSLPWDVAARAWPQHCMGAPA